MNLAGRGGLVTAAGEPAVLIPLDDRPADRGRDIPAETDVERQAGTGQAVTELAAAQE
jgi:hypothetical protein